MNYFGNLKGTGKLKIEFPISSNFQGISLQTCPDMFASSKDPVRYATPE